MYRLDLYAAAVRRHRKRLREVAARRRKAVEKSQKSRYAACRVFLVLRCSLRQQSQICTPLRAVFVNARYREKSRFVVYRRDQRFKAHAYRV